jgi:Zn-dependent peptidase ImmA (M78 family)
MGVRRHRIRLLVEDLLTRHRVDGPSVPIERIAREEGLQIRLEPQDSRISGFLFRQNDRAIIGINSSQARVRQRFTIAHELGHFFLHEDASFHVDRSAHFRLRSDLSSQGIDVTEIEANNFAAELLMPRHMIDADMRKEANLDILDDSFIDNLARRYGVSAQAMTLRLTNLGYVEQ